MLTDEGLEKTARPEADSLETSQDDDSTPEQIVEHPSDEETDTPSTLPKIVDDLAERVERRSIVGVIVFDASPLESWEHRHGSNAFEELMVEFIEATRDMCGSSIRDEDVVCRNAEAGDSILVFLARPRSGNDGFGSLNFDKIAERTKDYIISKVANGKRKLREALGKVETGSALVVGKESVDPRRQIYRSLRRARINIREQKEEQIRELHQLIGNVIARREIDTLYQPIVELREHETVGFEALSRVGTNCAKNFSEALFSAAEKVELEAELDRICRNLSIDRRPSLTDDARLFVNCLPATFYNPTRKLETLLEAWTDEGLEPGQLIFEINENITQQQADRILPTIRRLRAQGFEFALDDMGTGKTNLRLLAELEPTYIKMDISLTTGIGDDVRKQALASYLLDLAEKSDARLIAEGIENQRDLDTIVELGVRYGQGYLIGRPSEVDDLH